MIPLPLKSVEQIVRYQRIRTYIHTSIRTISKNSVFRFQIYYRTFLTHFLTNVFFYYHKASSRTKQNRCQFIGTYLAQTVFIDAFEKLKNGYKEKQKKFYKNRILTPIVEAKSKKMITLSLKSVKQIRRYQRIRTHARTHARTHTHI